MADNDEITLLAVGDINLRRENPETSYTHRAPLLR